MVATVPTFPPLSLQEKAVSSNLIAPVPGCDGYFVDEQGNLYSTRGRWGHLRSIKMSQKTTKKGYKAVCLRVGQGQKDKRVHRLVLEAFVGPCPEGMQSRHLDGDPANNRLDNLAWGTKAENESDRKKHCTVPRGQDNPAAKLTEEKVKEIRRLLSLNQSMQSVARMFGVHKDTIRNIKKRKKWGWLA